MTGNDDKGLNKNPRLDFTRRGEMLTQLALKQATRNPVRIFGMVKVFFLQESWQADWLRQEDSIIKPKNFNGLKDAIADNNAKTIFITDDIYVPVSALAFLCAKATTEKIIFLEGENND